MILTTTARRWLASIGVAALAAGGIAAPAPAGAQTATNILCTSKTKDAAAAFTDVDPNSPHKAGIDCLVYWKVTTGRTATTFAPTELLTRAQAASLMFRVTELADKDFKGTKDWFRDDNGSVHETAINALAEEGILLGRGASTFLPQAAITRGQAATLAVRSLEMLLHGPLPAGPNAFDDDNGHPHEAAINKAAAAGLIVGTGGRSFQPNRPIRRDEAATLMTRAVEAMAAAFLREI